MLLLAYYKGTQATSAILWLLYLGLLSDIFDGIIARKLGVADLHLRRIDSQVDLVFWLSVGFTAYMLHPETIRQYRWPIVILFAGEASCYLVSFIRFGKETCTHAWASKLFGLCMLMAFTTLIGFGTGGYFMLQALVVGYLSHLDRILITLVIPHWTHDIPSVYHAYLIKKGKPFTRYKLFN